jgi:hypothetical protein
MLQMAPKENIIGWQTSVNTGIFSTGYGSFPTGPTSLNSTDITGVEFAYGTGDSEGGILGSFAVPAPPSAVLLGFGGLSCLLYWYNRRWLPAAA